MFDPAAQGAGVLEPAEQAVRLLDAAKSNAARNGENVEQLLFGARNYVAMGRKLLAVGHYRDEGYPRGKVLAELREVLGSYEELQTEFQRLWLAEDRENDNFHTLVSRFDQTIIPFRQKIQELEN